VTNRIFERVKEVIEKDIRPFLVFEGGNIELVGIENGMVKVRLKGACAGCPMSQYTLVNFVEATLKERIPEVKEVVAVEDIRDKWGAKKIC
jgi:Fe-S cluster biogenesis protein NfuA